MRQCSRSLAAPPARIATRRPLYETATCCALCAGAIWMTRWSGFIASSAERMRLSAATIIASPKATPMKMDIGAKTWTTL
ncbi:hypothetical protein Q3G72_023450 [Acer saccharum]|nr:hypothetical protein Q3G72_023200 [Acer saccharum]KAK1548666.1 hypothetical protein Q3G72_023450 [Acer saccharum]